MPTENPIRPLERSRTGLLKYGVTVTDSNLDLPHWLQHAQEEALDLAVYLERIRSELTRHENLRDEYNELLFAVTNKYEGETRHQTALHYIQQAGQCSSVPKEPKSSPANGVWASA
jgi:hypothetical protein